MCTSTLVLFLDIHLDARFWSRFHNVMCQAGIKRPLYATVGLRRCCLGGEGVGG